MYDDRLYDSLNTIVGSIDNTTINLICILNNVVV